VSKLVLAYEPIWSIGTGEVASIEDIVEVLDCVKNLLLEKQYYSEEDIKFIYGGSVSSDNSTDILNTKIIDGALVGGASLDADKFVDIIKSVSL
jgi:triosephosphate isomerase